MEVKLLFSERKWEKHFCRMESLKCVWIAALRLGGLLATVLPSKENHLEAKLRQAKQKSQGAKRRSEKQADGAQSFCILLPASAPSFERWRKRTRVEPAAVGGCQQQQVRQG